MKPEKDSDSMKLYQIGLLGVLVVPAVPALGEIEVGFGSSTATALGKTVNSLTGFKTSFPEDKVQGFTFALDAVVRPFALQQIGLGLRFQESYYGSFRPEATGASTQVDSLNVSSVSPILSLRFQALSFLHVKAGLGYTSAAWMAQTENSKASAYRAFNGLHYNVGIAYALSERNFVSLNYTYQTMAFHASGTKPDTELSQLNADHLMIGLIFAE
jgi:opacity protein-like surface antigen